MITSAGLILAGTFAVLTIIPSWDLTMIGLAVALGVLLDTFVVRSVMRAGDHLARRRAQLVAVCAGTTGAVGLAGARGGRAGGRGVAGLSRPSEGRRGSAHARQAAQNA